MIHTIVTDIEGTTSSLSFVKDELFPFARRHIADFIHRHAEEAMVAEQIARVRAFMAEIGGAPVQDIGLDTVAAQLERWIDEDRKITELKALQGLIWEEGYRSGELRGHVYPDAEAAIRAWCEQGVNLYVYSSGSIHAQKLLFGHTEYGDLTPCFKGYFDTTTGPKQDPDSYHRIAADIGGAAGEILFLSDIEAELDAARAVGMRTCWLVREGELADNPGHPQVRDFSAIEL